MYDFIKPCNEYDETNIVLKGPRPQKDQGELEAIAQATEQGAMIWVDDGKARKMAQNHLLECHGTQWVLMQLLEKQLMTPAVFKAKIKKLQSYNIRMPYEELLSQISE